MAAPPSPPRPRRQEIEIRLPSRKRFVPGTAPRQPRISLLPAHDSTAFIVDKVINSTERKPDNKAQRRLCYIIGWTDLPAARIMIPCTTALEYVSPRTLEEWEYNDSLRREQEEWAQAVEEAKLLSLGMDPAEAIAPAETKIKKKRGRPPRAAMLDEAPPTPVLAAEDVVLIAKKKAAGPSLSTPQKRRLQELAEMESDYDSDAAVQRQLFGDVDADLDADAEQLGSAMHSLEEGMEAHIEGRDGDSLNLVQAAEQSSRGRSAGQVAMSQLPGTSSQLRGIRATQGQTLTSSTAKRKRGPEELVGGLETASRRPISPMMSLDAASPPSPLQAPPPKVQKRRHDIGWDERALTARDGVRSQRTSLDGTAQTSPHASPRSSAVEPAAARRPASANTERTAALPSSWEPNTIHDDEIKLVPTPETAAPLAKEKRKGKHKPAQPPEAPASEPKAVLEVPAAEEAVWEVKRLEGDRFVQDEDGTETRYFKVRWKGEWPPDQNPTWEPEENITRSLVKKYLTKKAAREAAKAARSAAAAASSPATQPSHRAQKTLSPWVGKKYASVTEAFQDGGEEDTAELGGDVEAPLFNGVEEAAEDDDEFAVTEDRTSSARSSQRARSSFDMDLARQYRLFVQPDHL